MITLTEAGNGRPIPLQVFLKATGCDLAMVDELASAKRSATGGQQVTIVAGAGMTMVVPGSDTLLLSRESQRRRLSGIKQ